MEGLLNKRLTKLLAVALDCRCSDGERLAAMNAAARMAGPGTIEGMLAASAPRARPADPFSLGMEQQLEILESTLDEKNRQIAAIEAEIARLRSGQARDVDDGIDLGTVLALTGLSRATLYRRMASGSFPLPCSTQGTRKMWSEEAVANWSRTRKSSEASVSNLPESFVLQL